MFSGALRAISSSPMTSPYGPVTEAEARPVARLLSHAFAGPLEKSEEWLRAGGLAHARVLREGAGPAACLMRLPMGQFFGGRSVPMVGVAGVAVGPESRGRGLARRIMQEALRELAGEGVALSGLYASTQGLYRQVGFEQAGHWFGVRLPLHRIDVREKGRALRPLGEADTPAVEACYRSFASRFNGPLDRGPYVWRRIRVFREETFHGFGIDGEAGLEGYLFLTQRRKPETGRHDVGLTDLVFLTAGAGRQLLAFLADFATVGDDAEFKAGPAHPLLALLGQQKYDVVKREYWMTRIVDLRRAIAERGYLPATKAAARFEIADDLLPGNAGAWTVRVEHGRGEALRDAGSGGAAIRCGIRGLAAMYTGFFTGREAALAGLAEGPDGALDAATAIFSGGTPWMSDMF